MTRAAGPRWRVALLVGALAGAACERTPAPTPTPPAARPEESIDPPPARAAQLRFAVAALLSPITTYEAHADLFELLGRELDRPFQVVQRRTYQEINALLCDGEVDLAFLSAGGYAALPAGAAVELLALPVVDGRTTSHAQVVVRADAGVTNLEGLQGKRFAFTDPLSVTGYLFVAAELQARGSEPSAFFSSVLFTGSHDRSLLALHQGLVDGAAVFDRGFDRVTRAIGASPADLRVVARSAPLANPPVVAPTTTPPAERARLRAILLGLHEHAPGRAALERLGVERFVPADDASYEPVRRLRAKVPREPR